MGQIQDVFAKAAKAELWAGNLITGRSDSGNKLENRTPIDNSLIGYIADGEAADIDAAVAVARSTFNSGEWSDLSPAERKAVMQRWAKLMEDNIEELAALDCIDAGKPISE